MNRFNQVYIIKEKGGRFMTVNIKDFGAVGDGKTLNTKAIQAAIDKVGEKGGRVLIEDGVYMTGTII